jgi:hypothetical protein
MTIESRLQILNTVSSSRFIRVPAMQATSAFIERLFSASEMLSASNRARPKKIQGSIKGVRQRTRRAG